MNTLTEPLCETELSKSLVPPAKTKLCWAGGCKTFFMLNSAEHEIYPALGVKMPNCWHFNIY